MSSTWRSLAKSWLMSEYGVAIGFEPVPYALARWITGEKALLARFKLYGPPGIIFFDKDGKEIESSRVVGFQDVEAFQATLSGLGR